MATNLNFETATYATANMLPDANEELTAAWGRQIMMNTARASGYWGTVYATNTTVATMGTAHIYFTGFDYIPSLDLWIYEIREVGGNVQERVTQWSDTFTPNGESGRVFGKRVVYTSADGTGTFKLEVYPYPGQIALGPRNENFHQGSYGTWIYRLRGL